MVFAKIILMTHKDVEKYVLSMPDAKLDYPFGENVAVYKVNDKMFALITEGSDPLQLSLKCDPLLAETLRAKYETVLAGYHLNKKHWNTILLTGQLSWEEVQDLIRHSYYLVTGSQDPALSTGDAKSV
jgi:predicted DNA-binding protein (MmcQ/YjbR family)